MSSARDSNRPQADGAIAAARREWAYLRRSRWDLTVLFALPLLTFVLLGVMFGPGLLNRIPAVLVDHDQSALSRRVIETLLAEPKLELKQVTDQDPQANHLLRSGTAVVAITIPVGLERAAVRGEAAVVAIGYNGGFQTAASQGAGAASSDVDSAIAGFVAERSGQAGIGAVHRGTPRVQIALVGNGQTSFERFLEPLVLAGVLHLLLSCAAVAVIGRELKQDSYYRWGSARYGLMLRRLVGKLLPPVLIYCVWFAAIPLWLCWLRGWPLTGHLWVWLLAQWGLCAATAGIAAVLVTATRDIDTAFSVSTIYAGSAITYSNGTLPTLHASWFTRHWSECLPFTSYLKVQNQHYSMGADAAASLAPIGVLWAMALVSLLLAGALWARAVRSPPQAEEELRLCGPAPDERRWYAGFVSTLVSIGRDRSMLSLCVLSVLLYGFYYPQAYRSQVSVKLPVVVVDQDHSALSRRLIRAIDATRAIHVQQVSTDLATAQTAMRNGVVDGVVLIGPRLQAAVQGGRAGGVAIYAPATYLVRARDIGAAVKAALAGVVGETLSPLSQAMHRSEGSEHTVVVPMYNWADGYGGYVVPAVAAIILHQTLLFGTAMLIGLRREQARDWSMRAGGFIGCWLALTVLGCLTSGYFLGFVFWFQDFPRMGNPWSLLVLVPMYVATVAAMGMALGSLFERADRAIQVMSGLSILLFFLGGVSWPYFAMPAWLADVAQLLPSSIGMQTFVKLNSSAASIAEVRGYLLLLALQLLLWGSFAAWRLVRRRPAQAHRLRPAAPAQIGVAG